MATSSINKANGLKNFPNYIDAEANGDQSIASNVVIDRDNILEPRRGMKILTDLPEYSKQLLTYKDRVMCHYGNSIGYLNTADPASMTVMKGTSNFITTTASVNISIVDHNLSVGDAVFFTKTRDYSGSGYFTFPTGINEVSSYVVYQVIDKDTFTIADSLSGSPIIVGGSARATIIYDFITNEVKSKLRIKYIELNSNLYFTTNTGVKKISQLNPYSIGSAGGITALGVDLSLSFSGTGGFFGPITGADDVEVAYRVLWGTKDVNTNLILGKPSERAFIQNYTRQNADVVVSFAVPQGITTDYFYQIYRTNVFTVNGSGDEMRLVYESQYDGYSSIVTITDSTPEVIRDTGTPLYTNELSGEGILQANDRPPVCEDICVYKDRAWFANTKTTQKLDLTFLGFDGFKTPIDAPAAVGNPAVITLPSGHGVQLGEYVALANTTSVDGQYVVTAVSPTSITINADSALFGLNYVLYRTYVTITKNTQTNRYFFVGKPEVTSLVAQPFASVVSSDYFNLTSIDDKIKYSFWFAKSAIDVAPTVSGRVLFKIDLYTVATVTADEVRSRIKDAIDLTGDFFTIEEVATGELTVTTITSGAVTDVASATQSGTSLVSIAKTQDGFGENISLGFAKLSSYFSPASAIEDTAKSLVKVINFTTSSPVYAYYLATSNSLPGQFYLEEKNFSATSFSILGTGFQSNVSFNPDITTAVNSTNNVGNNVLMFSKIQQPEAVPTTNSFRIGPQDKAILRILGLRDSLFIFKEEGLYRLTGENESNFNVAFFDNSGILLAPDSATILNNQIYFWGVQGVSTASETGVGVISRPIENTFNRASSENFTNYATASFGISYEADRAYILFIVDNEADTTATIAYRYNSFTRTWTSFDKSGICGVVSSKNKMYLGVDDTPAIEVERKKLTSRDYIDRSFDRTISAFSQNRIYMDDVSDIEIGDSVTQEQYLSPDEYNDLVARLKTDPTLGFSATFPKLTMLGGADLTDGMIDLVTELNIKDITRISNVFSGTASNTITIASHGFEENDIVKFTSGTPIALISDSYYRVVSVTTNTFKLTNLLPNVLTKTISTLGIGIFTGVSKTLQFNLIQDIDYTTSEIVFPEHGLVDGDVITYTNSATPITAVPPTGLQNARSYKVINSTASRFQVIEVNIDLNVAENGTLQESYYFSGETDNKIVQREFNDIVNSLNNSTSTFFANYDLSVGMEELDLIVTEVNVSQNYIKIAYNMPFSIGDVVHYQSIKSEIVWEYFTLGDPSMLKHVSEGTLMVEQNSLNKITLGYATDLSGNFENVTFTLDGDGNFGKAIFGETAFGGNGTSYPLRTLIPRMKQRCRHIKCRVFHDSAWMKYNILGISYKYEITSDRAYRR